MATRQALQLTDFQLQSGECLPELSLAYSCYGTLNSAADNAILFPTYYTGTDNDNARLIGPGRALDSETYFIVIPNLFGNGISASPSNMPAPFDGPRFPLITVYDNVRAQALLADSLGVNQWQLVLGWSMGGLQTYQWASQFPARVARALVICGAAKTAEHNRVFLSGVKATLETDASYTGGHYQQQPVDGLRAFGRVYAGWAYSQAFFRNQRYRDMGFADAEALLQDWEQDHLNWDANDLLAMLATWDSADIAAQPDYEGDWVAALRAITAETWLMPCEQDLYFRYEDNMGELKHLNKGRYCGFTSDYGHCAAGPGRFPRETALIEQAIRDLLATDG